MKIIKGVTIEEQIASIDTALSQHQRKLSKTVVGIIPPVPIFHYQSEPNADGTVFYNIMPIGGSVRTLCIGRETAEPKETIVTIDVTGSDVSYSYTLVVKKRLEVFDLDYPIVVGDRIRISFPPSQVPGGTLVALAIMPAIDRTERDVQMLSALQALEEQLDASESEEEEERPVPSKHTARRKSKRNN